jgi:tetratricopeptide (TPR) repeat protein
VAAASGAEVGKLTRERDQALERVKRLESELAELKTTPEALLLAGRQAAKAGSWEAAAKSFEAFLDRFPDHERAGEAREQVLVSHLERAKALSPSANSLDDYQRAAATLESLLADCRRCTSRKAASQWRRALEERIANWPVEVSSLKEMKVRYGDLRGRQVALRGRYTIEAATYYNCGFKSQSRWRSMRLKPASESFTMDDIYAYCAKSSDGCEKLFTAATPAPVEVSNVVLQYPRRNSICEEGQTILVSVK